MNKSVFKAGMLSVLLSTTANAEADQNGQNVVELIGGKGEKITMDCDLLDNGRMTSAFIRQAGIWGHMKGIDSRLNYLESIGKDITEKDRMRAYLQDLNRHGITPQDINDKFDECREKLGYD